MGDIAASNKRIAKNTMMLYFRMMLIMIVSLYTSRIVLKTLGVEDYGIYNVVGGVVTMLSFLNSSLTSATQRYINYEIGKNDEAAINKVFSMSFISFSLLAVIVVIVAETLGLWFVYNKLVIPPDRLNAALWVYHFSIMTFAVNMLVVPYTATIIANERMSVYAYVSIIEIFLKLGIVFLLSVIQFDKLILYAILMFTVTCIVTLIYRIYCIKNFKECQIKWIWDSELLKKLFSFSGWMLAGTASHILSTQGVNILINMFFGPAFNAARAVAMQVHTAVYSLSQNFMTAVKPQIVKSYAQNDLRYMYRLVFTSSKLCFYLLLILSLPLISEADFVLNLWLKEVPEYAVVFTQLVLISLLLEAVYTPIGYVSQAADKTCGYQLSISACFIMVFILTIIAYLIKLPVYTTFLISIIIDIIGLFVRLIVLKITVNFPFKHFCKQVVLPSTCIIVVSFALIFLIKVFTGETVLWHLLIMIFAIIIPLILIWVFGLENKERQLIINTLKIHYDKNK